MYSRRLIPVSLAEVIASLQKEVNELEIVLSSRNDAIDGLKDDIIKISEGYETTTTSIGREIDEHRNRAQASEAKLAQCLADVENLRVELIATRSALSAKTDDWERISRSLEEHRSAASRELERLKMQLSAKCLDLEGASEAAKSVRDEADALRSELGASRENEGALRAELDEKRSELGRLQAELGEHRASAEKSRGESASAIDAKNAELGEMRNVFQAKLGEIQRLQEEVSSLGENANSSERERGLREITEAKLAEARNDYEELSSEHRGKCAQLESLSNAVAEMESRGKTRDEHLRELTSELEKARDLKEALNETTLACGDLERKLGVANGKIDELATSKSKLEAELRSLASSSGDRGEQLERLNNELKTRESVFEEQREKLAEKLQASERTGQEYQLKLKGLEETVQLERAAFEAELARAREQSRSSDEKFSKQAQVVADLEAQLAEARRVVEEKRKELSDVGEQLAENERRFKERGEDAAKEIQAVTATLRAEVDTARQHGVKLNEELAATKLTLCETDAKFAQFRENSQTATRELEKLHGDATEKLRDELKTLHEQRVSKIETDYKTLLGVAHESKEELETKLTASSTDFEELRGKYEESALLLAAERDRTQTLLRQINDGEFSLNESLSSTVKDLTEANSEKEQRVTSLQEQLRAGERELEERAKHVDGLRDEIKHLAVSKHEVEENLRVKLQEIVDLQAASRSAAETSASERSEMKNVHEAALKKLNEQLKLQETEAQQLAVELKELRVTTTLHESSYAQKEDYIEQLKTELDVNHDYIKKLQGENKELLKQREESLRAQEEKARKFDELAGDVKRLRGELEKNVEATSELEFTNRCYVTIFGLLELEEDDKITLVDKIQGDLKTKEGAGGFDKLCELTDKIPVRNVRKDEVARLRDELNKVRCECQLLEETCEAQKIELVTLREKIKKVRQIEHRARF